MTHHTRQAFYLLINVLHLLSKITLGNSKPNFFLLYTVYYTRPTAYWIRQTGIRFWFICKLTPSLRIIHRQRRIAGGNVEANVIVMRRGVGSYCYGAAAVDIMSSVFGVARQRVELNLNGNLARLSVSFLAHFMSYCVVSYHLHCTLKT